MEKAKEGLLTELAARGYACRIVSVERLKELEKEIKDHSQSGRFDPEFYREYIATLEFRISPPEMPNAKSIIIIAMQRPQWGINFTWNGDVKTLTMHPIYVGYDVLPAKIEADVNDLLASSGYRVLHNTKIPLKLLAVRSGLAKYGRNNIAYVPGMGSYIHLFGFYSDLPLEEDKWQDAEMLERCQNCRACVIKCPTGAISPERFLIHAERCIAFYNEKPAEIPFPQWIDSSWHNCLIGCLICQNCCPENRQVKDQVEILTAFSQEETSFLLSYAKGDNPPASIVEKLEMFQRPDLLDWIPRNLSALLVSMHHVSPAD